MIIFQILLLVLLFTLPGFAVWTVSRNKDQLSIIGAEWLFFVLFVSVGMVGWVALLLAEFGYFSLPLLLGIVMGGVVLLLGYAWQLGWLQTAFYGIHWTHTSLSLMMMIGITLILSPRPFEYLVGGRDHGVYVNTGIHIARSGGILAVDNVITELPIEIRSLLVRPETRPWQSGYPGTWSEGQHVTGLTIRSLADGVYLPHAFHFFPAFIGVFYAVGGVSFAFVPTLVVAVLAMCGSLLVIRRLWGDAVMLLSGLLLVSSVAQMWFSKYPTAEVMIQLFFWGGVLLMLWLLERQLPVIAILAGAGFGLLHLIKMDTVLFPIGLLLFFGGLWLQKRWHPVYKWFWLTYLLFSIHAALHAFYIATIYFLDHLLRVLLPRTVAESVASVVGQLTQPNEILAQIWQAYGWVVTSVILFLMLFVSLLVWQNGRLQTIFAQTMSQQTRLQWGFGLLLGSVAMGTTVSSIFPEATELFHTQLYTGGLSRLYLSRLGLGMGIVGVLFILITGRTRQHVFTLVMVLSNMLPLYFLGAGTAPDHFWVIRRFFPIAFPFLLTGTAVVVWGLAQWIWRLEIGNGGLAIRRALLILPLGIYLLVGAGLLQHTLPLFRAVDYDGLPEQLTIFATLFPDDAVLLFVHPQTGVRFDLPLWFAFDKQVYTLRDDVLHDAGLQTAVSYWQANGRDIFWVLSDDNTPPIWEGWKMSHARTVQISTPLVETSRDRIPQKTIPFTVQFDVYAIQNRE